MTRIAVEGSVTSWANRPMCQITGCKNQAVYQYQYEDGDYKWRVRHGKIICSAHHRSGYHPVARWRKDHCENLSGFLGFKCTTTIFWDGMLEVDHKNGDPSDNRPTNLQTLCSCCHKYKTKINKDYLSDGRKALGITTY
jgi:hypothetical protein